MDRRQFIASNCLVILGPKCLPPLIPDSGTKVVYRPSEKDLLELFSSSMTVMPNGRLLNWVAWDRLDDGTCKVSWRTTGKYTHGYYIITEGLPGLEYKPLYPFGNWPKLIRS